MYANGPRRPAVLTSPNRLNVRNGSVAGPTPTQIRPAPLLCQSVADKSARGRTRVAGGRQLEHTHRRMPVEDRWTSRDLPVLDAAVRLLDEGRFEVTVAEIASETGLDTRAVDRALVALRGEYVGDYEVMSGGDPGSFAITEVTAAARRVVGQ